MPFIYVIWDGWSQCRWRWSKVRGGHRSYLFQPWNFSRKQIRWWLFCRRGNINANKLNNTKEDTKWINGLDPVLLDPKPELFLPPNTLYVLSSVWKPLVSPFSLGCCWSLESWFIISVYYLNVFTKLYLFVDLFSYSLNFVFFPLKSTSKGKEHCWAWLWEGKQATRLKNLRGT